MKRLRCCEEPSDISAAIADWRQYLLSRRAFLLGLAGGSVAALFGNLAAGDGADTTDEAHSWRVLDVVQRHLLPSEADSPGAAEINALGYLRFVVHDPLLDGEDRLFLLKGVGWLEGIVQESGSRSILDLDDKGREQVLRRVAATPTGENWLSTLILYLMEALLTDPAYGGNPDGVGWRWLQHLPGFPRPSPDKIYPRLLS